MEVLQPLKGTRSQGAEVVAEGVRYRTWSACARPEVVILDGDGKVKRSLAFEEEEEGYFSVLDSEGLAGDLYYYRLYGHLFPDPASRFQPKGVHGPSQVCSPNDYKWKYDRMIGLSMTGLVIYELHLGTFTPAGTFRGAIEKLPYLAELGITALELMPVADFPGGRNWGYDGVMLYAPARVYGEPDDLRALVDAAHGYGLGVILDVVYNHLGPDGNYMGAFHPAYFDRRRKTPWGDAINYAEPAVRAFFVENAPYWMEEFRIDAFRLDATHAIMDDSSPHILAEITETIHARGGVVMAEDERNLRQVCLPTECGGLGFDAVWADDFHHVVRVSALDEHEGHYGNYRGSTDELIDTLEHGWHYRGQPQLTNGKPRGSECGTLSPENFIVCISNHDQVGNQPLGERFGPRLPPAVYRAASTLLLLVPYTPMLFMGQEWNASTPFRFFTDHNCELGRKVTEGRRREFRDFSAFADPAARALIPDPQAEKTFLDSKLDWREPEEIEHASTLALYREGLQLRKWHPALQDRSREAWQVRQLSNHVLAIVYGREMAARIAVVTSLDCNGSVLAAINGSVLETGGRSWRLIFSSNNERFGGDGDGSAGAATIVLEAA